jgi:hypothetical protein
MSHIRHSTKETKKKPVLSLKEKKALKLERKRAGEHETPEIKVIQGTLNPPH